MNRYDFDQLIGYILDEAELNRRVKQNGTQNKESNQDSILDRADFSSCSEPDLFKSRINNIIQKLSSLENK